MAHTSSSIRVPTLLTAIIVAIAVAALRPTPLQAQTPEEAAGGPVVLMGIDAEDGHTSFAGAHGPIATYQRLVNNILNQTTKPATNQLLVIGCKPGTDTGMFWASVFPAHRCVTGGAAILAEDFTDDRMIAVVSDEYNTWFGGLTCHDEDPALDDDVTEAKIAAHVNAGGGLLGFSSDCPRPYDYISGVAEISVRTGKSYYDIDPTDEGTAIGVDNTLDVCCWHDTFLQFPNFLNVLAFEHGSTEAAAIGGRKIEVPPPVQLIPTTLQLTPEQSENVVDTPHSVNALVTDQFGNNMQGVPVTFEVAGVSGTISAMHKTGRDGVATFTYAGSPLPGEDVIYACVDSDESTSCEVTDQPSDRATKTWILPVSTPNCAVNLNKPTQGGRITAANGDMATFGGVAHVGPKGETRGEQQYQDHGPREKFTLHARVLAVICEAPNATTGTPARATIFALPADGSSFAGGISRIDVQDVAEPGRGKDTYRIRIGASGNYDSGEQVLQGGNVQVHKT